METNETFSDAPVDRAARSSRFFTRLHRWQTLARRLWWVPVLSTVLAVGAAGFYVWHQPPRYVSRGQMIVNVRLSIPEGSVYMEELNNFFGTQIALMQSQAVINRAVQTLQANRPGQEPSEVLLTVSGIPKTSIFAFTAAGADPEYTRAYLQACMEAYIDLKKEMRTQTSQTTLAGITEELGRLENELRKGEEDLVDFQKSNSLTVLQGEGDSAGSYLGSLNRKLADLRTEYQLLNLLTLDQNLERQQKPGSPDGGTDLTVTLQADPSDYLHAKQQIQLLKAQQQQLSEFLRPKHPKMVKLSEDIEEREKLLDIFRQQSQEQLSNQRDSIGLQIQNLEKQVEEWKAKSLDSSEKMAEYQKIKSSNQRTQNLYDRLLGTMQTLDINKEISPESVTIMMPASTAWRDRSPLPKTMAIALVLGIAVGLGVLLLVDQLDDRLASFTEIQEQFDEEILGQIPKDPDANNGTGAQLIHPHDARHPFVEAYRSLRSSLLFLANEGQRPKVLLVTSSVPGDGKTLTTANLAITMAQTNTRVLLIDADLRKGVLHQRFNINATEGLHEVLLEGRPWKSVVQSTSTPNLSLLPRGSTTQFSSELFLNPNTAKLLREVAEEYDVVFVDSPPVMAADDATSLAPSVDGVLFVVRAQQTSARVARAALDLLYQRHINVLGLVFNAVEANASDYYYYKYKDYYAAYPEKG